MISINDLTFGYKKGQPILSGINLELHQGKIYGLFGLNGAGKTTLLNNIAGMLFPKSGSCLMDGKKTMLRNPVVMSDIFIVAEQFDLPKLTGQKYIELHRLFYPGFDNQQMEDIMLEFDINKTKMLPELSFGQRKKFLVAFAIATQARLLIFDEPTNGLDIPSKSQFRRIISSLDAESRCILISTHQVRDLGSMIEHIIVLKDGSVIFNRSLEDIADRLSIQKLESDSSPDSYIYGEETLGGINAIVASQGDTIGEFDLELLFNGIIQKTEEMNQQFEGVLS
ncbi:MAG TPA: ABC transporter ATP-binding protein [Gracilimonas sp.]|uniref:ABC transporter ATP-binding protein n=1 Tax=Gracilimonas sp. TaxID=1974203 RepID=UPI002D8771E3|nr:ABC transporter ATP-binding protein [Gracilimonas sp.]